MTDQIRFSIVLVADSHGDPEIMGETVITVSEVESISSCRGHPLDNKALTSINMKSGDSFVVPHPLSDVAWTLFKYAYEGWE